MENSSRYPTRQELRKQFSRAENQFLLLLEMDDLDRAVGSRPLIVAEFEQALKSSIESAYHTPHADDLIHLFLQRVLYRINRLNFFWYDDLSNYKNEASDYLRAVRKRIESAWAAWELAQMELEQVSGSAVTEALRNRAAVDVAPDPSPEGIYFRDHTGLAGYRKLLEIASLDGLVEASQLSRTLGGVANEIHAMMTRLLVEEYGGGRLGRKHSSYFKLMLAELDMNAVPEAYLNSVPWEVLATINHSFMVSERKSFYLRYVGGLLYTEISVPAAFDNYRQAAKRLGMSKDARGYWDLHIKEDERHGRWMLNDVALPLARKYAARAVEIVLGYDQQKFMSARAAKAMAEAAKQADREARVTSSTMNASLEAAA